jgi:transketolase
MKNISMRDAFWNKLHDLARDDRDIVIVAADMGAPALDRFRRDFPGQFINVGIAEQNAIEVAAGLALGGKKPFAYAIAPFITLRCYEQIKVDLAGMNLPVTVVGVGAGFSYEDSGPTHHTVEDLSIMRILPNMTVNNISDSVMASAFAEISCGRKSPNYVRLDRQVLPDIYKPGTDFSAGLMRLRPGRDLLMVATGNMVHHALQVADNLKRKSVDCGVIDLYTLPINEELFLQEAEGAKRIVTIEEHTIPGGMGSAVCEVLMDNSVFIPVKRIGLDFKQSYCYKYGGRKNIHVCYGIDVDNLTKTALASA